MDAALPEGTLWAWPTTEAPSTSNSANAPATSDRNRDSDLLDERKADRDKATKLAKTRADRVVICRVSWTRVFSFEATPSRHCRSHSGLRQCETNRVRMAEQQNFGCGWRVRAAWKLFLTRLTDELYRWRAASVIADAAACTSPHICLTRCQRRFRRIQSFSVRARWPQCRICRRWPGADNWSAQIRWRSTPRWMDSERLRYYP